MPGGAKDHQGKISPMECLRFEGPAARFYKSFTRGSWFVRLPAWNDALLLGSSIQRYRP